MSNELPTVLLIRRKLSGAGGAERVFSKYLQALGGQQKVIPVSQRWGIGPGWLRSLVFAWTASWKIFSHPRSLSISLERGPAAKIFRAGDGVHLRYLELLGKHSWNPWHMVAPMLDKKSFSSAKVIMANSQMVAADIEKFYPQFSKKVQVVYNGFDPKKFYPLSDFPLSEKKNTLSPLRSPLKIEIRRRLGLPENSALFLFMGNGWERKGLPQALDIVSRCQNLKPRLVVVGRGKGKLPADERIIYKGFVENMPDYYRACDGFILPTLYDPFSGSVLEALACGLPVVTTKQNGAAEVVKEGVTGYLMNSQNENLKEAAYWLETHIGADPRMISETVAAYTVDKEIASIREIFKQLTIKN